MEELLNSLISPNTVVSLVTSLTAFYTSFKLLEGKVKQNTEDIKEIKQLDLKVRITEMQKDIQYMRERLDEALSKK